MPHRGSGPDTTVIRRSDRLRARARLNGTTLQLATIPTSRNAGVLGVTRVQIVRRTALTVIAPSRGGKGMRKMQSKSRAVR